MLDNKGHVVTSTWPPIRNWWNNIEMDKLFSVLQNCVCVCVCVCVYGARVRACVCVRINVPCSRTQRSGAGEARTRGPSVSSQALYHLATALPMCMCVHVRTCARAYVLKLCR